MEDSRQSPATTPRLDGQEVAPRRSALGEALSSRTPIRHQDSFERPNGFQMLDSTPRRFSTGAQRLPMPMSQVFSAQAAAEAELEARSQSQTPKERHDLTAAIERFNFCSSTPSIARLAALTSPCYFHKKFGDAVDIQKVLEEIQGDDQLSHSRLMQTAAGVREVSRQLQRRPLKRAVRNVMIITKARDNTLVTLTRELAEWLLETPRYGKDVGVNVYVDNKLKKSKRFDAPGLVARDERFGEMLRYWTTPMCLEKPDLFDLVITLGGDGTVLFTSWLFQRIVPPVLSFSLGSLGFLTNFEFDQYKKQLDRIMGDAGMRVNLRMRFTCTVYRSAASTYLNASNAASTQSLQTAATQAANDLLNPLDEGAKIEGETHEILNELVIDRGPSSYISSLDLYANDSLLTRISADGIILSTPTGSTAYSLSAGGSLVHPDIPAILLTPICPHTLSFRPMLLNDDMALKVSVPASGRGSAFISFDGKGRVELGRGDEVVVRASQYPFPTVMGQPLEWFDSISRTLRWNTRAAEQKAWDGEQGGKGSRSESIDEGGWAANAQERKEPEFDIDFDDEEDTPSAKDSGYEGGGSEFGDGGRNEKAQGKQWWL